MGSLKKRPAVDEHGALVARDTMFANQHLAYETLSDGMKRMLEGLTAIHSARRPYGPNAERAHDYGPSSMRFNFSEGALAETLRRVKMETGNKWQRVSLLLPDSWFRINILDLPSLPARASV